MKVDKMFLKEMGFKEYDKKCWCYNDVFIIDNKDIKKLSMKILIKKLYDITWNTAYKAGEWNIRKQIRSALAVYGSSQ